MPSAGDSEEFLAWRRLHADANTSTHKQIMGKVFKTSRFESDFESFELDIARYEMDAQG